MKEITFGACAECIECCEKFAGHFKTPQYSHDRLGTTNLELIEDELIYSDFWRENVRRESRRTRVAT